MNLGTFLQRADKWHPQQDYAQNIHCMKPNITPEIEVNKAIKPGPILHMYNTHQDKYKTSPLQRMFKVELCNI